MERGYINLMAVKSGNENVFIAVDESIVSRSLNGSVVELLCNEPGGQRPVAQSK